MAIEQGQQNRTSPPPGDYVIITPLRTTRIATNTEIDPGPTFVPPPVGALPKSIATSYEWVVQLDFYGDGAGDNIQVFSIAFRDSSACDFFTASGYAIQPLYADEPRQMPFVDESQQYEGRWSVDAYMQFNPTLATEQDYADTLKVQLINVEAEIFGQEN